MNQNSNPTRIMYLTHRDAKDKREWSGTLYYMAQALSKHAGEVIYAGPYYPRIMFFLLKAINRLSLIFFRKRYNIPYNYVLSLVYKYHFTKKIIKEKPDIIFAAAASGEMSQLKVDCPIIYLGDITLKLLIDRYPNFTNLSRLSLWEGDIIEANTFKNADAMVFSSKWAVDSAHNDYNVKPEKIHLIPYGANMDKLPTKEEVKNKKIDKPIKLLFLGVDWHRKGGDIVLKTFYELRKQNANVELTIVGCTPPEDYSDPAIHVIPFLNKNEEKDADILYKIIMESHFLFVPSRSDCTPIAFCEANAFGLPVITTNVGGISSVIEDGVNGHLLSPDDPPSSYASVISSYLSNNSDYSMIVNSSREYYDKYLNWDHWGRSMGRLIQELITKNKVEN